MTANMSADSQNKDYRPGTRNLSGSITAGRTAKACSPQTSCLFKAPLAEAAMLASGLSYWTPEPAYSPQATTIVHTYRPETGV